MTNRKISARKRKYNLDKKVALEIHARIFDENSRITIAEVFPQAVALALRAKHGIINSERLTEAQVAEMADIMLPLCDAIDAAATAGAARVFTEFHTDPIWRDYFLRKSAVALAKEAAGLLRTGGRPKGSRAPHVMWLENTMRVYEEQRPTETPTVKEHFRNIALRQEIAGTNEQGNLIFDPFMLAQFQNQADQMRHPLNDDPVITENSVKDAFTRLRKTGN